MSKQLRQFALSVNLGRGEAARLTDKEIAALPPVVKRIVLDGRRRQNDKRSVLLVAVQDVLERFPRATIHIVDPGD